MTVVPYRPAPPKPTLTPVIAGGALAVLIAAVVWGAFAFGAVYPWAYWPLAACAIAVGVTGVLLPSRGGCAAKVPGLPLIAGAFAAFLIAGALQMVPVPLAQLARLSPETSSVLARLDLGFVAGGPARHALSIAPGRTWVALALFASFALLVLGSARLLSIRGARRTAEAIAIVGMALAFTAIVQKPFATEKVYGLWTPIDGGSPYGPFVNRNHFAGWMLMGLPLTLGLLCAMLSRAMRGVRPHWRDQLMWLSTPDASVILLTGAGALVMAVSLVLTLSMSGMTALALAIGITGACVIRRRWTRGRTAAAIAYLMLLFFVAYGWAGADVIASRFAENNWSELVSRRGAWSDALDVNARFPLTGTGLNTYGVATILYQRHDLERHYDQAHNDYLQLLAEGGVLLAVPAALCLFVFARAVRRRFRDETSTTAYWLRVGAVTGLAAIALQETFDFSLQMPGNALLFAVLCGIALHVAPPKPDPHRARV
jgi:O-antigen ligase